MMLFHKLDEISIIVHVSNTSPCEKYGMNSHLAFEWPNGGNFNFCQFFFLQNPPQN